MLAKLRRSRTRTPGDREVGVDGVFRPAAHVVAAETEGRVVLMDLRRRGRYIGLDEVGSAIWTRLQAGEPVGDIVDRLAAAYDAPADRIGADARRFVADLEDARLVERA
jgi:hypothetical protein